MRRAHATYRGSSWRGASTVRGAGAAGRGRGFASKKMVRVGDTLYAKTGNGLGIPTRLYKIIIEKNSKKVMAYLMPNGPLPVADLPKYQTTVAAVEQATGFKFALPK